MTSWIPTECTLPTAEQPARMEAFAGLFAESVRTLERPTADHLRMTLEPTPAVAAHAAELAVREASCCLFFTFTLTADGDGLRLDVAVPARHAAVLDALAASAGSDHAQR
ncbi:MAG TPA: hypothetical protein VFZ63_19950 [Jiangellaceae bacterium]